MYDRWRKICKMGRGKFKFIFLIQYSQHPQSFVAIDNSEMLFQINISFVVNIPFRKSYVISMCEQVLTRYLYYFNCCDNTR